MSKKLFQIKLVHTVIWALYVFIIVYILYAGLFNKVDVYLFIAIGLVVVEGLVLLVFQGKCPLTILAYQYTDSREHNFDIFLPKWLAQHNKTIFGGLYIMGVLLTAYRLL